MAEQTRWLDDEEIRIAAESGMGMSWTPTIMMACQSYARIDDLMASGIKMGFGTDCFSMDVVEELRYALYSANYVIKANGFRLTAFDLIRRATIGGAECLGLADQIGTVEEGKRADLVVFDPETVGAETARLVEDLPGGTARLTAGSEGVVRVYVGGAATVARKVTT